MRRNGFIAGVIATLLAVVISFGAYRFVVNRSEFLNGVGRIPGGDFNSLITLPDGVDLTLSNRHADYSPFSFMSFITAITSGIVTPASSN